MMSRILHRQMLAGDRKHVSLVLCIQKIGTTCSLRDITHFKISRSLLPEPAAPITRQIKCRSKGESPEKATECRVLASHH